MTADRALQEVIDKERRLLALRERALALNAGARHLADDLHGLNVAVAAATEELIRAGRARVEFGDLRRTSPISPVWGLDRGLPLDRYYIQNFLRQHATDIREHVLEIKDPGYTRMFGGDRVTRSDVLDINSGNRQATVVADLSKADTIRADTFDCFILTQTLGFIFDVAAALRHVKRILKPGGVVLCTLPAIGRISYEEGLDADFWRFTEASARRLFGSVFGADDFSVSGYGNVLTCTAFLYGLTPDVLTTTELDTVDPYFPLVYCVRGVKAGQMPSS